MDDTAKRTGTIDSKEEVKTRTTGIAEEATVKSSDANELNPQSQPTQREPVGTTTTGPNPSLDGSESNNSMGMVGKRLILAQELAGQPQPQTKPTPPGPVPSSKRTDPANCKTANKTTTGSIAKTAEGHHPSLDMSDSNNSLIGMTGKRLILEQELADAVNAANVMTGAMTRHVDNAGASPLEPPQLTRQDDVQQNQQVLPGAVAVPGVGERQFGSSSVPSISDREQQDFVIGNHHDNHNVGLVEAESVDDLEQPNAIALPAIDSTNTRQSITQKYQLRFAGFAITLLLIGGIIIGSICGAGLCKADDSAQPTRMTERDTLQAPKMKSVLTEMLGDGYFDQVVGESDDDLDADLSHVFVETRQRAFDWIVNHDPMQLGFDAPNLVQRFVLVLFYYQTTRHTPWRECNPTVTGQESASVNFCYEPDRFSGEITSTIWGNQWLSDSHECQWAGVTCETVESKEKIVVGIHIARNGLNGPLPSEVVQLPQFKQLDLYSNVLTGTLPPKFFSNQAGLTLENLFLGANQFSGTLPSEWFVNILAGKGKLTDLQLQQNTLTGKIPSELGLLPLNSLVLANNELSGSIPQQLFHQSSLERLELGKTDLTGTLPGEIGMLTNLRHLGLEDTHISGSLPSEIGLAKLLFDIVLSNTNLQGTIPDEVYTGLDILQLLAVSNCNFSGTISSSIGLMTTLRELHLANNNFHGTIPNEIVAVTKLRKLLVDGNELTGTVPISFCENFYAMERISYKVVADCLPIPETGMSGIQCDCCTSCCDKTGVCLAN
ncbi:LRR receptor-like serine threonine-protein kinase [Seminavis robusta]|uniref:LRR receptor-like serine threonine-protein kinase n=1 Tax=Seminavis robusta TaxID=568900 RepID=A0A9N8H552_9STRA|nr:LRR receptor-like serine threonine-protein kinase [Seminavis robusta]|eukprot:Sro77_g042230.1 LRR receptor-like serine threonine-protein kinase (777) ;mRNA; r:106800-109318